MIKTTPYTQNSLSGLVGQTSGESPYLSMSQKAVTELLTKLTENKASISVLPTPDATSEKIMGIKKGAWVEVPASVPAAPANDSKNYFLCDGAWKLSGIECAPTADAKAKVLLDGKWVNLDEYLSENYGLTSKKAASTATPDTSNTNTSANN